jgi:hypothetical protein
MSHVHRGAHETLIEREVDRLARGHWLRPDAALDALTDDARAWLGDRLDELLAVLAPWAGGDALPTALALRVTRSMHEAERIWRDASELSSGHTRSSRRRRHTVSCGEWVLCKHEQSRARDMPG